MKSTRILVQQALADGKHAELSRLLRSYVYRTPEEANVEDTARAWVLVHSVLMDVVKELDNFKSVEEFSISPVCELWLNEVCPGIRRSEIDDLMPE